MQEITIRHITEFDLSLTEPIQRLLGQLTSQPVPFTDDELRAICQSKNSHLMVMYADTEPVGMVTIGHYLAPTGCKAWIEDVVIDSSMRGQGLGRLLVSHAIDYAQTLAPCTLMLTSRPSRIEANALYRSAGFEQRETNVYKIEIKK